MADQARRRRQRILATAEERLRKLKGIRTDEVGEEQTASVLLDRDAKCELSNNENTHADYLPVGAAPSQPYAQPESPNVREVLEESAAERPGRGVAASSNADTEFADENTSVLVSTADTASSIKHSTAAEEHAKKLVLMHERKRQQQQQGKTTKASRLWLLVAVVMVTVVALMHAHGRLSASSCFILFLVTALTQNRLQRPKSALQFLLSVLSRILTSVSLFMFTLVVYHMVQQ